MDKIQTKLNTFDNIKKDMEINTIKLHHKLDILEAKQDEFLQNQNERLTTIETVESTHHNMLIDRVTDIEHGQKDFELNFANQLEKTELQNTKMNDFQKKLEDLAERMTKIEMKLSNIPEDYTKLMKIYPNKHHLSLNYCRKQTA